MDKMESHSGQMVLPLGLDQSSTKTLLPGVRKPPLTSRASHPSWPSHGAPTYKQSHHTTTDMGVHSLSWESPLRQTLLNRAIMHGGAPDASKPPMCVLDSLTAHSPSPGHGSLPAVCWHISPIRTAGFACTSQQQELGTVCRTQNTRACRSPRVRASGTICQAQLLMTPPSAATRALSTPASEYRTSMISFIPPLNKALTEFI